MGWEGKGNSRIGEYVSRYELTIFVKIQLYHNTQILMWILNNQTSITCQQLQGLGHYFFSDALYWFRNGWGASLEQKINKRTPSSTKNIFLVPITKLESLIFCVYISLLLLTFTCFRTTIGAYFHTARESRKLVNVTINVTSILMVHAIFGSAGEA